MLKTHLLRLAFTALATLSITAAAWAETNCNVSVAAGLDRKLPKYAAPTQKHFRIFWHVSTQIEDIADANKNPAALKDIRDVQALVDGYYVVVLGSSPLSYWPGRPIECAMNFRRVKDGTTLDVMGEDVLFDDTTGANRQSCQKKSAAFRKSIGEPDQEALQFKAAGRALKNLQITEEQKRGKEIMGAFLVNNRYMDYEAKSDTVVLNRLPNTVCLFGREGIAPNSFMVYQEPNHQIKAGTYVWVPRMSADGKPVKSANPKDDKAPENPRVYDLVEDAFKRDGIPLDGIYVNVRKWNRNKTPDLAERLISLREIRGFNFEGGPIVMANQPRKLRNFAEGIAWVLKNTKENVNILMPGYWEPNQIGSDAEIDTLPQRMRDYVTTLNTMVSKNMGLPKGQNAFCTGRLALIPASYGRMLHVKTLPSIRNGKPAGTVTGNIRMLDGLRKEMCGS